VSFLSVHNLSRRYGESPALIDFSLEVDAGTICALIGPDGAGKTTMIRILCRLIDHDSGTVTIDGRDTAKSFDDIKSALGYMPQQFSLYPDLSVEENLIFYAGMYGVTGKAYREKRDYLYGFSNLAPFANRRAAALSGGMKQKLALSCALIHDPRLLILDEPTTGVDPLSRRQFWDILLTLRAQGVAILVSTPYMDEAARCDRACFIFGGLKLSEGTPEQLANEFVGNIYYLDCESTPHLIRDLNGIPGLSARRFGAGMHVYLAANERLEDYAGQLRGIGLHDCTPHQIKPDLEDRFIQLMESGR
jgi:ABC-2 type transport system ATP-binding protein